jgi:hypothetical protein
MEQHRKHALIQNLIFTAVILAAAGGLLLWRSLSVSGGAASGSAGSSAAALMAELVYGDDGTVLDMPLDTAKTYDVDTGYYTVHIEVRDGAARFVDSPCPDHICENYGWISLEDQQAICMPAHAVLSIVPAA